MPAFVTGQTKVFKAYGKKQRTHTANIRQGSTLDWNNDSPAKPTKSNSVQLDSDSDFSDTDFDLPPPPPRPTLRTPAKKKKALATLQAARAARGGGGDKENSVANAGYPPFAANTNQLATTNRASVSAPKNAECKSRSAPATTSSAKPKPLSQRREPSRSTFIGVVIDPKPRPRTVTPTSPPPTITLSDDDNNDSATAGSSSAAGNNSWFKTSAADGGLSTKLGDLGLTDSDDSDDCQVIPPPAARVKQSATSSTEVKPTYTSRITRKVSAKATLLSPDDSAEEGTTSSLPPPAPAPVRVARHTRSGSASVTQLAPPPSPPKRTLAPSPAASSRHKGPAQSRLGFPSVLKPLLTITSDGSPSTGAFDFTDFVRSPPAPLSSGSVEWRKVGEASFSEVFSAPGAEGDDLVVKIIPISPWGQGEAPKPNKHTDELPFMSESQAVEREVALSSLLGGSNTQVDGFVKFQGAFLVQGAYPTALLDAWDQFKKAQSPPCDDQIRPHVLPASQVYMMIVLSHGGRDLESYKLKSWVEAASVLWQVAAISARAEEAVEFEHRDLHWGNVLVQPTSARTVAHDVAALRLTPRKPSASAVAGSSFTSAQSGMDVTLIDFTLSRAVGGGAGGVLWDGFEDECVFEGEGDSQFDVYRSMRDHVKGDWEGYHPLTNLMWIHHLATKLLTAKKLKKPVQLASRFAASATSSPARRGPTSRSAAASLSGTPRRGLRPPPAKGAASAAAEYQAWSTLKDVEQRLAEVLKRADEAGRVKGRKGKKAEVEWRSAGDLVAWWRTQ